MRPVHLAAALILAGGWVLWRIGPNWRQHYAGITYDVLTRRNP